MEKLIGQRTVVIDCTARGMVTRSHGVADSRYMQETGDGNNEQDENRIIVTAPYSSVGFANRAGRACGLFIC
jgi:hypothetical protein